MEIEHGICITNSVLAKFITPPDQNLLSFLRSPPSPDWDHKHDEALVQFLVQVGRASDGTSGRAGTIWEHVDKIELSSAVEEVFSQLAAICGVIKHWSVISPYELYCSFRWKMPLPL